MSSIVILVVSLNCSPSFMVRSYLSLRSPFPTIQLQFFPISYVFAWLCFPTDSDSLPSSSIISAHDFVAGVFSSIVDVDAIVLSRSNGTIPCIAVTFQMTVKLFFMALPVGVRYDTPSSIDGPRWAPDTLPNRVPI